MSQLVNNFLKRVKALVPQNKMRVEHDKLLLRLKTLEAQVEKSSQQLEVAKSSFLKNIYHEIRTPLNSIMGFTNLLNRDNLLSREEKENYIALINKSSSDFLRIMDDIIQSSLLEADMITINYESCNLGDFFEENNAFFSIRKHIAEKNNVALLLSINDSIKSVEFTCDKFRVTQVLTHLVDNAFKNTTKGTVEYGCTVKDNNMLEFFVKDSSHSMIEGRESNVFARFSKLDCDENSKGGLGLGLSICKNLVELMGGEIWYDSKNGEGAVFYYTIPIIPVDNEDSAKSSVSTSATTLDPVLRRHSSSFAV